MHSLLLRTTFVAAALTAATPVLAIKLVTDENAPFAYTDPASKKIVGTSTDMVEEAARRAKVPFKTEIVPWARANMLAKSDAEACIFPLARIAEREALFRWVGPLTSNKWVLYGRTNFPDTITSLSDLGKYSIGGLLDDSPSMFLKSKGVNVDMVADNTFNVKKLAAGRIDLWATGLARGKILAAEVGVTDLKPVFTIKEVEHFLACNLAVPEETIKSLNQAVSAMQQDGAIKKIYERYP